MVTTKRENLLRAYQARQKEMLEEILHLERVQGDEARRRGFIKDGIDRAVKALSEGTVFLSGEGAKGVLIVGLQRLQDDILERFCSALEGRKTEANYALLTLDGVRAKVRKNKADTCWVIEIGPAGAPLFAWPAGCLPNGKAWEDSHKGTLFKLGGPRLPVSNGGAWWVGVLNATTPIDPAKSPLAVEFVIRGMEAMAKDGMTPLQRCRAQQRAAEEARARRAAIIAAAQEAGRRDGRRVVPDGKWTIPEGEEYIQAAERLAGETGPVPANLTDLVHAEIAAKRAEEEARLAAERAAEEARRRAEEEARLAAEKAAREAAEAEARRKAEIEEKARQHSGLTVEQWSSLPEKKRRLEIHKARLAGLIPMAA